MSTMSRRIRRQQTIQTPILALAARVDDIRVSERRFRSSNELEQMGMSPRGRAEFLDELVGLGTIALMEICTTPAIGLADLVPQLGSAFVRLEAMVGAPECARYAEDVKDTRLALASALLVLRDVIPAADLRCGFLVEDACKLCIQDAEAAA